MTSRATKTILEEEEEVSRRSNKNPAHKVESRKSVTRVPSRRSVHLAKFLKRRPTNDELMAKGYLKHEAVFGCKLEEQKFLDEEPLKAPEFIIRCLEKIEQDPENLKTTGIYRVPGDAAKIQKLRIEIDQGNWEYFNSCDDVHVLAGSLKLFLRELPEPLLPYCFHPELVRAALGLGAFKGDIVASLEVVLVKLELPERDTLCAVVRHLGRVAAADNKMDVENLALLFGQVLLWPNPQAPLDMKLIAEAAKNVQVADALIRYNLELFPKKVNTLSVPL